VKSAEIEWKLVAKRYKKLTDGIKHISDNEVCVTCLNVTIFDEHKKKFPSENKIANF
jgi:hypothetical protein